MSQPVYRNAIILNYDSVTRSRRSRDSKASYLLTSSNRTREDDIFSSFVDLVNAHDLLDPR